VTGEPRIAGIVEGHGEVDAFPALVRNIAAQVFGGWNVRVGKPHRLPKGKMTTAEIERAVTFQGFRAGATGGVLIIVDADDDCPISLPATSGP
jgi:hypothetical protein